MRDKDTITKAMLCCAFDLTCIHENCPYFGLSNTCEKAVIEDALVLVRSLDKENAKLKKKLEQINELVLKG